MSRIQSSPLAVCVMALLVLGACANCAPAQVFVQGNLVVYRVGDGTAALSNASTAAFLDQFTVLGSAVNTTPLPVAGGTAFTNAGNATSEGFLQLSTNGQYLTFGGYNIAPGTAAIAGTTGTVAPRSVGLMDSGATFTLSSLGTTAFSGGNIRSVISTNGTDTWATGSNQGIQYHLLNSGTASGNLVLAPTNARVATIFGGQLYMTSASGSNIGQNAIGTGLPTVPTGVNATNVFGSVSGTGTPSPYSAYGLDNPLNPVAGIDTFYLADDRAQASGGGLQRWVFDGASWTLSGTIAPPDAAGTGFSSLRGMTASVAGSTVTLYGTTTESNANRLVTISDTLSAGGGTFGAYATLATASANTAFRGIAFAPTPIPEPTSLLAVGVSALIFGRYVRRGKK